MTDEKKKKLSPAVKGIVEDWHARIGNKPFLVGSDLRRAMVAECVMFQMIIQSAKRPDYPATDYVTLYEESCEALASYLEVI